MVWVELVATSKFIALPYPHINTMSELKASRADFSCRKNKVKRLINILQMKCISVKVFGLA